MHILFFVDFHDSTMGGVQTSVRAQRQALEKLDHHVTVVCPAPTKNYNLAESTSVIEVPIVPLLRVNGFPVVRPSKKNLRFIKKRIAQLPKVDLIHVQTNIGVGILGVQIAREYKIPVVQTMHGRDDVIAETTYPIPVVTSCLASWLHARYVPHTHPIQAQGLSSAAAAAWEVMIAHADAADWVTVPSQHFKDKFLQRGLQKQISVISNGLSNETLARFSAAPAVRAKDDSFKIIWCGRLSPEKRPFAVIEAFQKLEIAATLELYGKGSLLDSLQQYLRSHDLENQVTIREGSQIDVMRAMRQSDVLVYCSSGFDNQPMVLIEATASQLPVILCDPDLIECVPTGGAVLTADTSPEAIADELRKLARNHASLRSMRQALKRNYDSVKQTVHTGEMVQLYKKLINAKK